MKRLISILSMLVIISSGCVSVKKSFSLDYKTDGSAFHLSQSCIENFIPKENSNAIFIKIKNNTDCSEPFNLFWEKSIGKKVSVFFNGKPIFKDIYTVNKIHTENGFNQAVESNSILNEIVNTLN
ncbi:hypothetical protein [Xenorhabdus sp. IM139775]|uniref:hypothetical protein n=1 Tax=Xenorhabdus sp. IM139775 TaxID=3025876 RepID=UPI00235835EE|nr:hypothetical protein [Xenorhabdus sp. IM139775]MDC9595029.1 hypothetical protein [Xenorhabdus sp. IM139775]